MKIGNMYRYCHLLESYLYDDLNQFNRPGAPQHVIKEMEVFQLIEIANPTPWNTWLKIWCGSKLGWIIVSIHQSEILKDSCAVMRAYFKEVTGEENYDR